MSLSRFINTTLCNDQHPRQIINRLDRAAEIEGYTIAFECLLILSTQ